MGSNNQEKSIKIGIRKITDHRTKDPGFTEADIFFSPVDVIRRGETIIGKVGYSDQRLNPDYKTTLARLIHKQKGSLILETISIDEADQLGLANKPAAINMS